MMKYKHQKDASNLALNKGPASMVLFPQWGKARIDQTCPTAGLDMNSLEDISLWGNGYCFVVPEGG